MSYHGRQSFSHVVSYHVTSCHVIQLALQVNFFIWEQKCHNMIIDYYCSQFLLFQNLYKQQQKLFQQQRIVQGQRLKRVRQLHEDYTKNLQEMQRSHDAQQISVQEQLRKEVNMLQKKILSDTVG